MSESPTPGSPAATAERLIDELRAAVRARDELLDIAAHELRNPMTALLVQVEDARRLVPDRYTELDRRLARIEHLIERYVVRATALLDASRLATGAFRPDPQPVDAAALVRDAAEAYAAQAAHAGATLRVAAPKMLSLTSDRLALEQIVDNLVSNAVRFGAGAPVDIGLARQGRTVRLTVRDRGIGISAADQARIFEPFERVIATRPKGGFGLGLWIARRLVEALGGTMLIAGTPGEGSTVSIRLPCEPSTVGDGTS